MPDDLLFIWPSNPWAIVLCILLILFYTGGVVYLRLRNPEQASISSYRAAAFSAAILLICLVLLTPVDTIARTKLFSFHAAQIVLLTTLCSPLLLVSCPPALAHMLLALPVVRQLVGIVTFPLVASLVFNLTFLLWHIPGVFDVVAKDETLYHLQILSIFLASLLNWWPLMRTVGEQRPMSYPLQMLYAFFDGQPVDIFAFILLLNTNPIYTLYTTTAQTGFGQHTDQALAGGILLIPGVVDLVLMSLFFIRWLALIEQRTKQEDQRRQEEEWESEEEEYFQERSS
jgi:cytochrome c oxidase assembly factor CtaG